MTNKKWAELMVGWTVLLCSYVVEDKVVAIMISAGATGWFAHCVFQSLYESYNAAKTDEA